MSRRYGSSVIPVAVFLAILLVVLPVSAANVTTETTTVLPTTNVTATDTATVIPTTNVTATGTTNITPTDTVATTNTTTTPRKTTVTVSKTATVVTTANLTIPVTETPTTGSVKIFSSPAGASILIDGIYVGTTPGTVNGVPAGTHILRLSLSGYYDYEGSIYVVPGQTVQGYGTLQPMSQVTATPTAIPTVIVPVIVTVTPEPTQETGLLGNSTVLAAILGMITAVIAAVASVFTHLKTPKK
jgi:hypothetical protein